MRPKDWIRNVGAGFLWRTGLSLPARTGRDRLTIVTFHRVLPDPAASPLPHLAVTPDFLRSALGFFSENYTCLPLAKAASAFFAGERPQRPLLAVTFDDGRKDNFLHGLPALRSTGLRATFFVPAGQVEDTSPLWHDELAWIARHLLQKERAEVLGSHFPELVLDGDAVHAVVQSAKALAGEQRRKLLTALRAEATDLRLPSWEGPMPWSELRQLAREGHEIGSHSMSHDVLLDRLGADQETEVAESRRKIEEETGAVVRSFCFPTGEYDETTLREIRAAGYACAVTTKWGSNDEATPPLELRRIDVQGDRNAGRGGRVNPAVLAWRLSRLPGTPVSGGSRETGDDRA